MPNRVMSKGAVLALLLLAVSGSQTLHAQENTPAPAATAIEQPAATTDGTGATAAGTPASGGAGEAAQNPVQAHAL